MSLEIVFMTVLGLACGVLGWFARELYNATQSLRKDLSALEVKLTADYVRYDRLQDAMKPIMESLHEIKSALRNKADK
jgi:cell division protein FtsB